MALRIGTAGWTLPREAAAHFTADSSHLQRYAGRMNAVEINSSFHRPHRKTTYERWAASTPGEFKFCVKVPKRITHEKQLQVLAIRANKLDPGQPGWSLAIAAGACAIARLTKATPIRDGGTAACYSP